MPLFSAAHDFTIQESKLVDNQGVYNEIGDVDKIINNTGVYNEVKTGSDGMGILKENVATGAFHNSNERFDPPKCYPNTRTAILDEIMSWVENSHSTSSSTPIMWLYGPAGAGKSAIVQTITEKCNALRLLAASFFFCRTAAGRNDEKRLIPTISYQLALSIPGSRSLIEKEVEADPLIFSRSLEAQMRTLITIPLLKARRSAPECSSPMLITIDGLDECHGDVAQRSILEVLFSALNEQGHLFCCLIASRPEQIIRQTFNRKHFRDASCRLVLDNSYSAEADIRHFLQSRCNEIKQNHSLQALIPDSWPLQTDIETLVRKSSGQFIYASTAIKYVDSPKHRPHDRLNIVLGISSSGSDTPFAELDALYKQILSSTDNLDRVLQILGALILIRSGELSPRGLEILFSLQEGDVFLALNDLHSILHVPEPPKQDRVRILHASLSDFLFDRLRAGELFINTEQCHTKLARCCIRQICSQNPTSITSMHQIVYHYTVQELTHHLTHSLLTQELLDGLGLIDLGVVLKRIMLNDSSYWKSHLLDLLFWCKSVQVQETELDSTGLYTHLLEQADCFLMSELGQYPQSEDLGYFLALVSIGWDIGYHDTQYCWKTDQPLGDEFAAVFNTDKIGPCLSHHHPSFFLHLSSFLNSKRAGKYYICPSTYTKITIRHIKYFLSSTEHQRGSQAAQLSDNSLAVKLYTETAIMQVLPNLLDKGSPSRELSSHLQQIALYFSKPQQLSRNSGEVEQFFDKIAHAMHQSTTA